MRIDESDLPSDARFGLLFTVIFLALGSYWAVTGWLAGAAVALVLGLVIGVLTKFRPAALRKPNMAWALLGLVLGKVLGTLTLGLIFLLIITPLALVFRLAGRDELRLRRRDEPSYWRNREDAAPASKFSDQF